MKTICTFLWGDITNDARVQREIRALSESAFNVTLISLADNFWSDEKKNPINSVKYQYIPKFSKIYKGFIKYYGSKILGDKELGYTSYFQALKNCRILKLFKIINILRVMCKMIIRGYIMDVDIYHCNDLNTLLQGVICSKIRLKKRKLVYDSHEVQVSRVGYNPKLVKLIEGFLIKFVDLMMTTTQTRADYIAEFYNITVPVVVPNYPEFDNLLRPEIIDLKRMYRISTEDLILLYQGGLSEGRNLENIIQAMALIEGCKLFIIGDGRLKYKLKDMSEKLSVDEKVYFIDKVEYSNLLQYTRSADIGFQLLENTCFNHYSALSNKLFEYIACNVTVIATKMPEISKIVQDDHVGIVIEDSSPKAIAKAVEFLKSNTNELETFKRNCSKASQKYTWNSVRDKYVELYINLMGA